MGLAIQIHPKSPYVDITAKAGSPFNEIIQQMIVPASTRHALLTACSKVAVTGPMSSQIVRTTKKKKIVSAVLFAAHAITRHAGRDNRISMRKKVNRALQITVMRSTSQLSIQGHIMSETRQETM